jgi:menaquinone reductase, molybdopterin-binding-like subunit
MKIDLTRRDVLRFAGGSAAGVMLSPAPWKLIDDVAIWTQNWSWVPVPRKGAITARNSVCSLCPAGCGVEARCVGNLPVSLRATGTAAAGRSLCPLGLTAHHLAHHPARIHRPYRLAGVKGAMRPVPVPLDAVMTAAANGIGSARKSGAGVAVLDMRPGRSTSWGWRRLLSEVGNSCAIPSPGRAGAGIGTLATMLGVDPATLGLDLASASTLLSFGAPLATGWGSPATTTRLLSGRDGSIRLIQVEPVRSRTAGIAQRWIPARPGSEAALALGIAHALLAEGLVAPLPQVHDLEDFRVAVASFTPAEVSAMSGIDAGEIVTTARELARGGPAVAFTGDEPALGRFDRTTEAAVLALNVLLGSIGNGRGIALRRELPQPFDGEIAPLREIDEVEDGSIALLFVDATAGDELLPWSLVERKLVSRHATVIAFTPYLSGSALHADYVVPTAASFEAVQELPTPFDAPAATLALSAPLLPAAESSIDPMAFVRELATATRTSLGDAWESSDDLTMARIQRISEAGRGKVTSPDGSDGTPAAAYGDAGTLSQALLDGGRWTDDPSSSAPAGCSLLAVTGGELYARATMPIAGSSPRALTLQPRAPRDAASSAVVSPVLTKIYRESGLRHAPGVAVLNPATARAAGLRAGARARLEAAGGSIAVTIATDSAVMPGVVEVAAGPDATAFGDGTAQRPGVLDIVRTGTGGVWRRSPARLVEG